jgi:hypothetical protein
VNVGTLQVLDYLRLARLIVGHLHNAGGDSNTSRKFRGTEAAVSRDDFKLCPSGPHENGHEHALLFYAGYQLVELLTLELRPSRIGR